ncbi:MAG: hypothetical protein AB7O66_07460 [Limisphaerales bacterium]
MSHPDTRALSNNFQDVRLVSLARWSKAGEIFPRDNAGPYVVTQQGLDPSNPTMTADEFILGRSGKWLALGLFYGLPVDERRAEFIFGTSAEVMRVMGNLPSKAEVFGHPVEAPAEGKAAPSDDMASAIRSGLDRKPGPA